MSEEKSILESADLNISLDELFDKDPLELTEQQKDRIITALANSREHYFNEANKAKRAGKQTPRTAGIKSPKSLKKLDKTAQDDIVNKLLGL